MSRYRWFIDFDETLGFEKGAIMEGSTPTNPTTPPPVGEPISPVTPEPGLQTDDEPKTDETPANTPADQPEE